MSLVSLVLGLVLSAHARDGFVVKRFSWKADSRVEIQIQSGKSSRKFSGELREGEPFMGAEEGALLTAHAFSNSFVAVTYLQEGDEAGEVVILERVNGRYYPLSPRVRGSALTALEDLVSAVGMLEKLNGWDHSIAIRSVLAYFSHYPKMQIADFLAEAEKGGVSTVAKPQMRRSGKWATRAIRGDTQPVGAFATREEKVAATEGESGAKEKRRPRMGREPLPYEPRMSPPPKKRKPKKRQQQQPGFFNFFFGL